LIAHQVHPIGNLLRSFACRAMKPGAQQESTMPILTPRRLIPVLLAGSLLSGCMTMDGMADDMDTVMVGGAAMYPTRNIVENAVNSNDHTTLVAAVKAAGLVDTLSGPGPFTVFAPTNAAFEKLPAGTVDTLLMPQNKAMLQSVLTYHVVPGRVSAADLMQRIQAGGGMAMLTTVQGGTLTAKMMGGNVVLVDEKGGMATVTQADVFQSNGVIHVTDTVSMPG
jgi:uncharacterized surface protein with fasciclin (FAS1) repeats